MILTLCLDVTWDFDNPLNTRDKGRIMKPDTYSIKYYIDRGHTIDSATAQVNKNKLATSLGVTIGKARTRIKKFQFLSIFTPEELLEFEKKLLSLEIFKNSPSNLASHYKFISSVICARGVDVNGAYDILRNLIEKFDTVKHHRKNTQFIKELFGENSVEYHKKIKSNSECATCSFEKFSMDYDDKEHARIMFREKYGSANLNGLMKRHGVDEKIAKGMIDVRMEKSRISMGNRPIDAIAADYASRGLTLINYTNKFGETIGTLKYEDEIKKRKGRTSKEWYIDKYGDEDGTRIYTEKRGAHTCYYHVDYWIHRGMSIEDATKKVADIFSKRPNFSLSFCIDKYGVDRGTSVWKARTDLWQGTLKSKPKSVMDEINSRKGTSLEKMISTYGVDVGTKKYETWLDGRCRGSSKIANRFFMRVYKNLRKLGIISNKKDVKLGVRGSSEYFINRGGNVRFYDFTIPAMNVMVEYNGLAFHPREGDIGWRGAYGADYETVLANDLMKQRMAYDRGFDLMYVWEDEDEDDALNRVLMFIIDSSKKEI